MKELVSSESAGEIFTILNNEDDNILEYEFTGTKGEYFVNLKKKNLTFVKSMEKSALVMNYNFLYPFHVMKSTKNLKGTSPVVHEVKKDQRWHVTYAS
jgi:predicted RNA-binding protein with EMAP domain